MATPWIDFKELRSKLSFAAVLQHYRVEAKVKGEKAYALCPLPTHAVRSDAKKRTASLSINLSRNIFQCFGCKASGNVLEFCARMEGFNPDDPGELRTAAVKITQVFGLTTSVKAAGTSASVSCKPAAPAVAQADKGAMDPVAAIPTIVNAPLDFELKQLDRRHLYLASRGFTPETIDHFGLGFSARGMMKDRIAIPLHNAAGQLIGYAGRLIDDEQVSDEKPKYLFPGAREREGKRYAFHKGEIVYNLNRLTLPLTDLIVVEGFASVWWLHQHGWSNVVALMGSSLSSTQAELMLNATTPQGRLWLLTDGDQAGADCGEQCLRKLAIGRFVRWLKLSERQPTDLSADELSALLRPI